MASLTIEKVKKQYGRVEVLKDISIKVQHGEFLVLVGPSGCGKSTLLNLIAGLDSITSGTITIGERVVNSVAPKDRDIAMVFQSYALYPNMTVRKNISFGLETRKISRGEIERQVARVATMLQIENLLDRKPAQLSGGQRQRVAMGRALARNPAVFLFDEPLSNLDAKLRVEMRTEIKRLHQKIGATIVYVTHDQIEAMTLADRIAIMKGGFLQQLGMPRELYEEPKNLFVAGFIGSPPMNFIPCTLEDDAHSLFFTIISANGETFSLPVRAEYKELAAYLGKKILVGIRPEHISCGLFQGNRSNDIAMIRCPVAVQEPTGADTMLHLSLNGTEVTARVRPDEAKRPGEMQGLEIDMAKVLYFDPESEKRICASRC